MRYLDLSDWYWIVDGDETRIYSSASRAYVSPADTAYQAWLAGDGMPSRISSEQELCDLLNAPIEARMVELERKQARPMRERALPGATQVDIDAADARLQTIDDDIGTLRQTLFSVPLGAA